MFDHLLESSHRDDSNMWSNLGFGEEIGIIEIQIHTLSGALGYMKNIHENNCLLVVLMSKDSCIE